MTNFLLKKKEYLAWLAQIVLAGYYDQVAREGEKAEVDEPDPEEVTTLVDMTMFWIVNDKPDATELETIEFMFDNRRL